MDNNRAVRCVLRVSAVFVFLTGCGRGQSPANQSVLPQAGVPSAQSQSLMPEAKNTDLLYITDYSTVLVYTYPQLKHVMTLRGFYSASAECTDADGNIYVTNEKPVVVYEYAHGGTKRLKTFSVKHGGADACAVDPTSGDLAVSGNSSAVTIFEASGGKQYRVNDPAMVDNFFCTYDKNGNLFVDGLASFQGKTRLAELLRGTKKFVGISSDTPLALTSNIQWDGSYLTALYYVHGHRKQYKPFIAQLRIKQSKATKVAAYPLGAPAYSILQYYISGDTLFVPNWYYVHGQQLKNVLVYKYPSGGAPTSTFTKVNDPRGVILSPAQARR